jgi:pimeloyl-ACP methyl ester carboxylesterase
VNASEAEAPVQDVDLQAWWAGVSVPTLLLRGADSDILTSATAAAMVSSKPAGVVTLVEFAGVGHAPALLAEDQLSAIERWVQAQPHPL